MLLESGRVGWIAELISQFVGIHRNRLVRLPLNTVQTGAPHYSTGYVIDGEIHSVVLFHFPLSLLANYLAQDPIA